MLTGGDDLLLSFEAKRDPDGATANMDGIYVGFSKDGMKGILVKITLAAPPPLMNSRQINPTNWWKTTDGGITAWQKQGLPQSWATSNVRAWSGSGTENGSSWAINAKLSLADLGSALELGGPLGGPFLLWFEIHVEANGAMFAYEWPAGAVVTLSPNGSPLNPIVGFWGTVFPSDRSKCPKAISADSHAHRPQADRQRHPQRCRPLRREPAAQ
jgi:hypothetical protein